MSLTEDIINETLSKSFIKRRKAEISNKNLSTSTPPENTEEHNGVYVSDSAYNVSSSPNIEYILQQKNQLINKWRSVSFLPEVDEAIEEIENEVLVFEEDNSLPFELNMEEIEMSENLKEKINEKFEKIVDLLKFNLNGKQIFRQFYDVQFLRVMPGPNPVTPASWKGCLNYENITSRSFVCQADL